MQINLRHLALPAVAAAALAGCGSESAADSSSSASAAATSSSSAVVTLADGWVKTASKGDMTGVFGTLHNPGSKPVKITTITSPLGKGELHETAKVDGAMQMRAVDSFTIPAGGEFVLKPGANHIMVMGLKKDVRTGETVTFTVGTSDGEKAEVKVVARAFTGAKEDYGDLHPDHTDHSSHGSDTSDTDHSGDAHHSGESSGMKH